MPPLSLYNTMTRAIQPLEPADPPQVRLYCCGPTVYNYAHIGNLRTYIFEDLLRRTLKFNGFDVHHVMNITDVGHMTTDADAGDDKMEVAAQREQKSPWELARFYEDAFFHDTELLNIEHPDVTPRATEHVVDMITLIERLEANGYTYVTSEGVYFDTSRDDDYGKLARLQLSEQRQGARAEVVEDVTKRHPSDFVLWFLNKPTHIMQWPSKWGQGYPGWHIECSAMSMRYLGETFDLHCGGVDHIPVHHTNEIAQSESATGHTFVKCWLHGEFLLMDSEKISKSKGGSVNTLQSLIDSGYDPLAYRYFCMQAHYRSRLNFSLEALDAATTGLRRIYALTPESDALLRDRDSWNEARQEVLDAINLDLGIPTAVGLLNGYGSLSLWREFDPVLGLKLDERMRKPEDALPPEVQQLREQRATARAAKDWKLSDGLRDQLIAMGYEVLDSADGETVRRKLL